MKEITIKYDNYYNISIYFKYFWNTKPISKIVFLSKKSRLIFLNVYEIKLILKWYLKKQSTTQFLLQTNQGLISSKQAINLNIGGKALLLCY